MNFRYLKVELGSIYIFCYLKKYMYMGGLEVLVLLGQANGVWRPNQWSTWFRWAKNDLKEEFLLPKGWIAWGRLTDEDRARIAKWRPHMAGMCAPREATVTNMDKREGKLPKETSITSALNALHQPCQPR